MASRGRLMKIKREAISPRPSIQGGFLSTLTGFWRARFVEQSSLEPDQLHRPPIEALANRVCCGARKFYFTTFSAAHHSQ